MKSNVIRLQPLEPANASNYTLVVSSPLDAEIILEDLMASMKHQLHEVRRASRYCQQLAQFKTAHEREGFLNLAREYQVIHAQYQNQLSQWERIK